MKSLMSYETYFQNLREQQLDELKQWLSIVQPVDPLHLWTTPPFEPDIRDGKLYARGATDDKGQVFLHIKAIEAILNQEERLPVNIKLCIEGEEEVSSRSLPPFLTTNRDKLCMRRTNIFICTISTKGF
jgi:acetylornithine deacetylase/succinyl-diaminopimelate desuccinylase-like protein